MQQDLGIAALLQPQRIAALTELVARAAAAVIRVCGNGLVARQKADMSPVTAADEAAEAVILAGLARLFPGLPVISEEKAAEAGASVQPLPPAFLLVDPLDGTRELLAGRAEFTVNAAVIAQGAPVLGIVAAPALGVLWRGCRGGGAERLALDATCGTVGPPVPIRARAWPRSDPTALVSRSHLDPATTTFLARFAGIRQQACGSALKFCHLAEGSADIYPRLAPTCEWDVAAGHALLTAAGGAVFTPSGTPLAYGHVEDAFRIPSFVAFADPSTAAWALPVGKR